MFTDDIKKRLLKAQKNEITEYVVYKELSGIVKNEKHSQILRSIAEDELAHYGYFKKMTGMDCKPDGMKAFYFVTISRFFGLNFGLKLMEQGEDLAQDDYAALKTGAPGIEHVMQDEERHENALIDMIDEDSLKYTSSVILGLNDALIELTATVAGFTLALQNTKLIGMLGLITGIAAAMSMAASEYLATKHDEEDKDPVKACLYTGISYIGVVAVLVMPYFLFTNIFVSLILTILLAVLTIFVFTFYVSVSQEHEFKSKFIEMAVLSVVIAGITFLIGLAARTVFGISV
ncbi:MAG: VIT1/CCC1 transporter family protein [Candidatus Omnitrophica bacterium]|nr:VIT1/CCC1 transporter family protein [Candidatus Omnitrophota bacterium]